MVTNRLSTGLEDAIPVSFAEHMTPETVTTVHLYPETLYHRVSKTPAYPNQVVQQHCPSNRWLLQKRVSSSSSGYEPALLPFRPCFYPSCALNDLTSPHSLSVGCGLSHVAHILRKPGGIAPPYSGETVGIPFRRQCRSDHPSMESKKRARS